MHINSFDQNSAQLNDFLQFSQTHYFGDPYYTGFDQLPGDHHIKLFIASAGNKICGRVAAIINESIKYYGYKTGLIGWYECIDDDLVSKALIAAAVEYLYSHGCIWVIGPMNGNTWNKYRLTEPSANRPFFLENYHKQWYLRQFASSQFSPVASYYSAKIDLKESVDPRIHRFESSILEKGIRVRNLRINNFDEDIKKIYDVCKQAFTNNFLYTPIDFDSFKKMYTCVRPFLDPSMVLIAEDQTGEAAGFLFAVPDLFDPDHSSAIIKTVAVIPGRKFQGLGTYMGNCTHTFLLQNGYSSVIHALIHESNISGNILSKGSAVNRKYYLYGMKLV